MSEISSRIHKLVEKNETVWDNKKFANIVTSIIDVHTNEKPLSMLERIKRRLCACYCILRGEPMVYYENTKNKYFKDNPVTRIDHIIYYDKSKY